MVIRDSQRLRRPEVDGFHHHPERSTRFTSACRRAGDPAKYDFASLLTGRVLNVGRLYGATAISYPITPLVKIAGYAVVNFDDRSTVLWPRLEWSARTNLDIVAGVQRFGGSSQSEYGRVNTVLHGEARWFF